MIQLWYHLAILDSSHVTLYVKNYQARFLISNRLQHIARKIVRMKGPEVCKIHVLKCFGDVSTVYRVGERQHSLNSVIGFTMRERIDKSCRVSRLAPFDLEAGCAEHFCQSLIGG